MNRLQEKIGRKSRRKLRIRKKLNGTASKPRLSVFKSNKHIYAQVIDDKAGHTLTSISNVGDLKTLKVTIADAEKLGQELGTKLKALKIDTVIFDRNGNLYHGVIKAFADGTRKAGIQF
jgi:large subunit ribosomal protein L18